MEWILNITFQVIAGLVLLGLVAVMTRTNFGKHRRVKVLEPEGERINGGFYDYFCASIDSAVEEILVTGEGFDFTTDAGVTAANRYHEAMERALRRGVRITRVQTARPLSKRWAQDLGELVDKYPDTFDLHILANSDLQDIASVCVIDPDRRQCISELMISVDKDIGTTASRVANTALFIHGRKNLAESMRAVVRSLTTASIANKIRESKEIDQFLELDSEHLYFAFGSNMSKSQMKKRCPSSKFIGVRKLAGYELVFNRIGDYRPGGVASIHTASAEKLGVYGALWKLSSVDMKSLDADEVPTSYQRISVVVTDDKGSGNVECQTYVGLPQPGPIVPDREYLEIMINAALEIELPQTYIDSLIKFRQP